MSKALMEDIGKLVLRLAMGGMMLVHGFSKVSMLFSGGEIKFADPLGIGTIPSLILAAFAEFLCAAAILAGFKARIASIPLIITMAVAAFIVHSGHPFGKKELALLYLAGYLAIALLGSGKYSVDGMTGKKS